MPELSDLKAQLIADVDDYIRDMNAAGDVAKKFGKDNEQGAAGTTKGSAAITNIGNVVGGLVTAGLFIKAGEQILDFAKSSVTAASDVQESVSKFNTVFKDQAQGVTLELANMADEINRSKYDLMEYAATFQDTFVPLGFARDQAADLSVALVALAEDLASFNNLNTADVVRDLQSALVGNTETVRKYGVVASQAAIQQKALEMGIWDGTGAIDAQAKAMATYQIILAGTSDAQGDAARTADSYANVQKGLEAAVLDLKVAIGDMLLPVMTELAKESTEVVKNGNQMITFSKQIAAAFSEHEKEVRKTAETYQEYRAEMLRSAVLTRATTAEQAAFVLKAYEATLQLDELQAQYGILTEQSVYAKEITGELTAEQAAQLYEIISLSDEYTRLIGDLGIASESMFAATEVEKDLQKQTQDTSEAVAAMSLEWWYAEQAQRMATDASKSWAGEQDRVRAEAEATQGILETLAGATANLDGAFSNNTSMAQNMLAEWEWAQAGGEDLQTRIETIGGLQVEPEVKKDMLEDALTASVELDVALGNLTEMEGAQLLKDALDLTSLEDAKALLSDGEAGILDDLAALDQKIYKATTEIDDKTAEIREALMETVDRWEGFHYATFVASYDQRGGYTGGGGGQSGGGDSDLTDIGANMVPVMPTAPVIVNHNYYNELAMRMAQEAQRADSVASVESVMG